jgi:hypothetical protein
MSDFGSDYRLCLIRLALYPAILSRTVRQNLHAVSPSLPRALTFSSMTVGHGDGWLTMSQLGLYKVLTCIFLEDG